MQNMGIERTGSIINATETDPTTFVPDGHSYDREVDAHKIHSGGKLDSNFSVEDLKNFLTQNNVNINAKDEESRVLVMHIAGRPNGEELLKWMIKHRADLDLKEQDEWKQTALFYAKTRGVFNTLINHGLDPHARNYLNQTALFNAVHKRNMEVVESAVEHGIDVNAQDVKGETVLFIAARKRLLYIVKYLLANGADPCIVDKKGKTA